MAARNDQLEIPGIVRIEPGSGGFPMPLLHQVHRLTVQAGDLVAMLLKGVVLAAGLLIRKRLVRPADLLEPLRVLFRRVLAHHLVVRAANVLRRGGGGQIEGLVEFVGHGPRRDNR